MDRTIKETDLNYFNGSFINDNGKKYIYLKVPDELTANEVEQELRLLQMVYGVSSSRISEELTDHYKHNKSFLTKRGK